jgi:stage V sporulation protein D (sporulation-specific penicillin-binding protein)
VLGAQLYNIHIKHHEKYERAAIEQQVRETTVTANRGAIYDRNGKILAMSATAETVYISPREIEMYNEDPVMIAQRLSEILGKDYSEILTMTADTSSWYKTVARKVEQEQADQVREFKNEYNLVGVKIEPDSKRYYPNSSLAAQVIGFVGVDNEGLSGIEYSLDSSLYGYGGPYRQGKKLCRHRHALHQIRRLLRRGRRRQRDPYPRLHHPVLPGKASGASGGGL